MSLSSVLEFVYATPLLNTGIMVVLALWLAVLALIDV
jgi:hypothetical protein